MGNNGRIDGLAHKLLFDRIQHLGSGTDDYRWCAHNPHTHALHATTINTYVYLHYFSNSACPYSTHSMCFANKMTH